MQLSYAVFTLLLGVCLTACQSSDKKGPALEEAARYHQQATEIEEAIEPKIKQIDSLKAALTNQNKPDGPARVATLDSLKTAFAEWEENLVEVPGMPHQHGKGEHHHHHDATLNGLPADQMRDVQRATLNSIRQIQTRLDAAMKP